MEELYHIAIIIITGIFMAKLLSKFNLPHVTGYLIGGVIIGPSIFNLVSIESIEKLNIISEVALGLIAYSIGSEINFNKIKKVGKSIITITVFEGLLPVVLVTLSMVFIFKQELPFAIILGAIAAATAPAATVMVIKQYKAKGPLIDTLLPVVALDDALAIISFGISFALAKSLLDLGGSGSLLMSILLPLWEIALAILVGIIIGVFLTYISNKVKGEDELLSIIIAFIFLAVSISSFLNVSSLLLCMSFGVTISNLSRHSNRNLQAIERFTPPIFIAFFTLAGAELNLSVLRYAGFLGLGYVFFRSLGKIIGAYIGAKLADTEEVVQKYLGLTLLPQAGVAIGLSMMAQNLMPELGATIRTIILASTVIYELFGPMIAKTAMIRAKAIE